MVEGERQQWRPARRWMDDILIWCDQDIKRYNEDDTKPRSRTVLYLTWPKDTKKNKKTIKNRAAITSKETENKQLNQTTDGSIQYSQPLELLKQLNNTSIILVLLLNIILVLIVHITEDLSACHVCLCVYVCHI